VVMKLDGRDSIRDGRHGFEWCPIVV